MARINGIEYRGVSVHASWKGHGVPKTLWTPSTGMSYHLPEDGESYYVVVGQVADRFGQVYDKWRLTKG